MTLQTFAKSCANMQTTQLRVRLMGKSYNSRSDCEFIFYGEHQKDYENGYWNGATADKRTPQGKPWKYATFDHVSAYDDDSIIVYVSEPQEWKPYFSPNKNSNSSSRPNPTNCSYNYGRKKENNLL